MLRKPIHNEPPPPSPELWKRQTLYGHLNDIADRLPSAARAKLERLRAEARAAADVARIPYCQMQEKRQACSEIERRISELTRSTTPLSADHPLIVAEREMLEKFKGEAKKLDAEHSSRKGARDAALLLVSHLESYVARLSPGSIALAPTSPAHAPAKGETPAQAVESIRIRIAALRDDLQSAYDAPIPAAAAKKIARAHIEWLASAGRPNVLATLEGKTAPRFATKTGEQIYFRTDGEAGVASLPDSIDVEATLAWLFKDQLVASLERAIDDDADDASALSDKDRAERIAAAKKEILICEREEERLIEIVHSSMTSIARRADADPRAVLGLADTAPEPRA